VKYRLLFISTLAGLIVFLTVYAKSDTDNTKQKDRFPTVMRRIGHQLLLSAGDSQSRVLPVKQLADMSYRVQFENQLSLEPGSLIRIISDNTKSYSLPDDYTVNVLDCSDQQIVYSFVMSAIDSNMIVSCLGRTLPKNCYYIDINFSGSLSSGSHTTSLVLGGGLVLLFLPLTLYLYKRGRKAVPVLNENAVADDQTPRIQLGAYLFDIDQRQLTAFGEMIQLTDKEGKLLTVLSATPNMLIDRDFLQKEIWEKEGVIVTRSLDMFISRLRKKLEKDPGIKIVNVHGKGYKLEIPGS